MLVEFVVAAGKKEQARALGARRRAARSSSDGARARRRAPADIAFTATPADAEALHDGTLDLSVGFMRGQVKMAGDFGTLLRVPAADGRCGSALAVADLPARLHRLIQVRASWPPWKTRDTVAPHLP